ncbi:hypothetical protein [Haloarchaeobius sp. TZWSO28]|uniref:hypothetical protein n=1 Tax=Haloarchaeobius sp. TZWSO28 TaxID=3446119 RepID=UPI003EC024AD
MDSRPVVRLLLVVCLLGAVGVFTLDYAATEESVSTYPTDQELDRSFERYHGDEVFIWVEVVAVRDASFVAEFGPTDDRVVVTDTRAEVAVGDEVQVYGIARSGQRIDPERLVVSEQGKRTYMLVASGLSVVLTLGLVFSRWRPDPTRLRFVPRDGDDGRGDADE